MSDTSVEDRLVHMRDAISSIERLTRDKTLEDYCRLPNLAAAVERYTEIVSEASRHIPDEMKRLHPEIDWRGLADIGNILRHVYDQIIHNEIWKAIERDIPPLKHAVAALLDAVQSETKDQ